ncbi:MAG: hypothetical protein GWP59_07350 [Chlamydiales bacterium]|nr:hypothetical protein [Chlamydiales bacterium]
MMSRAYEALPDPIQRSIKEYAVEETLKALTKDRTIHIAGKSIYTIKATRDYSLALVTLSSVAVALYNKDKISTAISSTRNSAANIAEKLMLRSAVSGASTLDACAEAYSGAKDKVGASISRVVTSTSDAVESAKTSASNAAARASTTIRMSPEMAKLFVSSRAESCNEAIKARILA